MERQFHLNRCTGRQQCRCIVPKAVNTVKSAPEDGLNLSPETCRANLKILINERLLHIVGYLLWCKRMPLLEEFWATDWRSLNIFSWNLTSERIFKRMSAKLKCSVMDHALRSRGGKVSIVTRLYAGWSGNRVLFPAQEVTCTSTASRLPADIRVSYLVENDSLSFAGEATAIYGGY